MSEDLEETNPDEVEDEYDESQGRHYGWCRGCKEMKTDCSNDDGWCGDCN